MLQHKKHQISGLKQRCIAAAVMTVLLAMFLCVLPHVLPYERIHVFYGVMQGADRHYIDNLPVGAQDQTVYLSMDNLMSIPETVLILNGEPIMELNKQQTDGIQPLILPARFFAEEQDLVLSLQIRYSPFLHLSTNQMTLPVVASEEMK